MSKSPDPKRPDTHPFMVVKPYMRPEDYPKFRYFKEAQNYITRDISKVAAQFKRLNVADVQAAVDDLEQQVNALMETGGVVAGVIEPYTQMVYTAEVVRR